MGAKTILKILAAVIIVVPAIIWATMSDSSSSKNSPFESVCNNDHDKYTPLCKNIGKRAHIIQNMLAVNDTDFGEIVGIAWRVRGSSISAPGQKVRYSAGNFYYYIIRVDEKGYFFLRLVREVDPR